MKLSQFKILLNLYTTQLEEHVEYYSLNQLTANEEVSNAKFHALVKKYEEDEEVVSLYNKIYDVLEFRVLEAVNAGRLDRELGKMMLRSFHRWDEKKDDGTVGYVMMGTIEVEYVEEV